MMKLCVIGDPVEHSLSPRIHSAFFRQNGCEGSYERVQVTAERLPAFLASMRAGRWDGCNVTMPLKTAIVPYLDSLDSAAAAIGAVNTVVVSNGRLLGYNTDAPGLAASLPQAAGGRVLLLGSGGAARAGAFGLTATGAAVTVCCRHPEQVTWAAALSWERLREAAARCTVLVNATPLGMTGEEAFPNVDFLDAMPADGVVCDLVYEPRCTALLHAAQERGLTAVPGTVHLLHQAALSFRLFTGRSGDPSAVELP